MHKGLKALLGGLSCIGAVVYGIVLAVLVGAVLIGVPVLIWRVAWGI